MMFNYLLIVKSNFASKLLILRPSKEGKTVNQNCNISH